MPVVGWFKGQKDRMVPIGARTLAWTNKYIHERRPHLIHSETGTTLYVRRFGETFRVGSLLTNVHDYVAKAERTPSTLFLFPKRGKVWSQRKATSSMTLTK